MKNLYILIFTIAVVSCKSDPNSPGVEYMPDMYYGVSYETYSESSLFKDSATALIPPQNAIARGQLSFSYPYSKSNEGYEAAGLELKNPMALSQNILDEGKVIYGKFCVHCHGEEGLGNGKVPENSDYPNPPAYNGTALIDLPEGKMYHTITYGKNLMGSHASQLSPEERWKVIHYVTLLQNPKNSKFTSVFPAEETTENKEESNNQSANLSAQLN